MTPAEHFKLACQCLVLDENQEQIKAVKQKFISEEVDLDYFIKLCSNHLVLPAIYLRLHNAGIVSLFTEEYANHLENIYLLNKKRNIDILAQINEISNQLSTKSINPIYLKGTANLIDNLYSDEGIRMIGDIDFLVKDEYYFKTVENLFLLNYENQHKTYEHPGTFKHFPRLFKKGVPADVEIHRIPVNIPFSKQFNTELLFSKKRAVKTINNCFVSADEHKLIHTFIHSQLSNKGYKYRIIGLRDLYDTYLLLKRVNYNEVLLQIEEKRKAKLFFHYTNHLFSNQPITDVFTKKFIARHRYFLNHPRVHLYYFWGLKLYELIIIRYLWQILKAPFQRSSFNHIYLRLKDPQWYKRHFEGVRHFFKG